MLFGQTTKTRFYDFSVLLKYNIFLKCINFSLSYLLFAYIPALMFLLSHLWFHKFKVVCELRVSGIFWPKKSRKKNQQHSKRFWVIPTFHAKFSTRKCPDISIIYIAYKNNRHILVWGYRCILIWYQDSLTQKITNKISTILTKIFWITPTCHEQFPSQTVPKSSFYILSINCLLLD